MTTRQSESGRGSGKVILFGEHAVVYGVPAIAAALSRGAIAKASSAEEDSLALEGDELPSSHGLLRALRALRARLGSNPVKIELDLEIPKGAGLGASAAMGIASARAICALNAGRAEGGSPPSDADLFHAVQCWEEVFHGTPSGVDVAAAQGSGAIRFEKGKDTRSLVIDSPLHLAVAQAGPPASTREMVEAVARFQVRNPVQFQRSLDAIRSIVENATLLLSSGDLTAIGKLMDLNQILLASWMLSTSEIELACRLARDAGALGAKLTGAGGGGSVIALAPPTTPDCEKSTLPIIQAWRDAGIPCFSTEVVSSLAASSP